MPFRDLGNTTLGPHHLTKCYYPVLSLLDVEQEREALLMPPYKSSTRHKPLPLITEETVMENAGRDFDSDDLSFPYISYAHTDAERDAASLDVPHKLHCLSRDMAVVESMFGETKLYMVTYGKGKPERAGFKEPQYVRIHRVSRFRLPAGGSHEDTWVYDTDISYFWNASENDPMWYSSLRSLLMRSSDYAVRHVEWQLNVQQPAFEVDADYAWKGHRYIKPELTELNLPVVLRPQQIPTQSPVDPCTEDCSGTCCSCSTCYGKWSKDCKPVSLDCDSRHILCEECMSGWVTSNSAETANCPICRHPVFPAEMLTVMQAGIHDGRYEYDNRYNEWENWERSNSDLDHVWAEDIHKPFDVCNQVLRWAWLHMMEQARCQTEGSTPLHLQPCRFPETRIAKAAVLSILEENNGTNWATSNFFDRLVASVYEKLYVRVYNESFMRYYSARELIFMTSDPATNIPMRYGFHNFLERTLNRMLNFASHRSCTCMPGYHQHGLRWHYNPKYPTAQAEDEEDWDPSYTPSESSQSDSDDESSDSGKLDDDDIYHGELRPFVGSPPSSNGEEEEEEDDDEVS